MKHSIKYSKIQPINPFFDLLNSAKTKYYNYTLRFFGHYSMASSQISPKRKITTRHNYHEMQFKFETHQSNAYEKIIIPTSSTRSTAIDGKRNFVKSELRFEHSSRSHKTAMRRRFICISVRACFWCGFGADRADGLSRGRGINCQKAADNDINDRPWTLLPFGNAVPLPCQLVMAFRFLNLYLIYILTNFSTIVEKPFNT